MNHTYAYLRDDHKIKFRMVSVQNVINEALDVSLWGDTSLQPNGDTTATHWLPLNQLMI